MDDVDMLTVIWTENAFETSLVIKEYLAYKFTQREIDNFYKKLAAFEVVIKAFPEMHPIVNKKTHNHAGPYEQTIVRIFTYTMSIK